MAERSSTESKPAGKAKPEPTWEKHSESGSAKQGWYKATRTLRVKGGTLYQTTTEHRAAGNKGGHVIACAESLAFVPSK